MSQETIIQQLDTLYKGKTYSEKDEDESPNTVTKKQLLTQSGASEIRAVEPGMMMTMDWREDRLNVYLDSTGKVERLKFG